MRRFFGVKKAAKPQADEAPAPTLGDSISRMDERQKGIQDKIRGLDKQIAEIKKKMAKTRSGPAKNNLKRRALMLLKQRKQYEGQLNRQMQQQFNMEQVQFQKETLQDTMQQVKVMKEAQTALKTEMGNMQLDDVEDLFDDMMETMDDMNEIQDIMSQSFAVEDYDEDELLDELAQFEEDGLFDEVEDEVPEYMMGRDTATVSQHATCLCHL
ncbi:MAG: hypothetical protein MHM6MM_006149 [Cercozoa sp. M6MM]